MDSLLAHADTELYPNVMGQGREPIFLTLNRGHGNYPIPNHIATFERRPEISELNTYITHYRAEKEQIENFDLSNSTSIVYKDLFGNSHTNVGPIFGKKNGAENLALPKSSPVNDGNSSSTMNDGNSEL